MKSATYGPLVESVSPLDIRLPDLASTIFCFGCDLLRSELLRGCIAGPVVIAARPCDAVEEAGLLLTRRFSFSFPIDVADEYLSGVLRLDFLTYVQSVLLGVG